MRSTAPLLRSRMARRASRSSAARMLARAGLAARGVLYILIGWLAILVAFGQTSRHANQQGALRLLAGKPYGLASLWLLGIGFASYALWRLSEAAFGAAVDGNRPGPRLRSLVSALIYAGFAYLTFTIISGAHRGQIRKQRDFTAQLMDHTSGRWLVGIAGLVIVIVGVVLVVHGVRRTFLKYMQLSQMNARTRRTVERLGVIGTTARGLVFALAGALVIDAAITHAPGKVRGIDKALLTLRNQPFGELLLILAAAGLVIFGIYGLAEARW